MQAKTEKPATPRGSGFFRWGDTTTGSGVALVGQGEELFEGEGQGGEKDPGAEQEQQQKEDFHHAPPEVKWPDQSGRDRMPGTARKIKRNVIYYHKR
jgi:hypothetical protein